MFLMCYSFCLFSLKVLEQVSPKISEVICKVAHENPERNRNTAHLPGKVWGGGGGGGGGVLV